MGLNRHLTLYLGMLTNRFGRLGDKGISLSRHLPSDRLLLGDFEEGKQNDWL